MLVTNPNLCVDRLLSVDTLAAGTVSRPSRVVVAAGGKGVNVLRTAADLGRPGTLVGLVPTQGGDALLGMLRDEGIATIRVPVAGAVRAAIIVLERSGRATVLNEPGPTLAAPDLDHLVAAVAEALPGHPGPLVCSGSLPPGLPVTTYGRLVAEARRHARPSVVDAAREALAAVLDFGPDVVTPNLAEAEGLTTGAVTEPADLEALPMAQVRERAVEAGTRLVERGAGAAAVTAGGHGVCLVEPGRHTWVPAHRVAVVNPIGAGDAFTGGLAVALEEGRPLADAVHYAVAVAGAAVEDVRAGHLDPARAAELASAPVEAGAPR